MIDQLFNLIADWDQQCRIGDDNDITQSEREIELFVQALINSDELTDEITQVLEDYGFDDLID
ncbi:MAG: hypothetical protein R3321_06290 [Nitrososphaeraceae archaeon]|nr:hypothetical protein [Nitrososphaeraceae archaeon]